MVKRYFYIETGESYVQKKFIKFWKKQEKVKNSNGFKRES